MNYAAGKFPKKDIAWYLRNLENSIVETLKIYGVEAVGKSLQKKSMNEDESEETGVWVGPRKIASLGIAVRKWISYHGAAVNLDEDLQAFYGMNPCGFKKEVMISLENILQKPVDRGEFTLRLKSVLTDLLFASK
jgi:lipoyl(octanoyl) transferase